MAPDPHQGGRLEDMAAKGTTIPDDAGTQRLVSYINISNLFTSAIVHT
jgi:hypothetical protein